MTTTEFRSIVRRTTAPAAHLLRHLPVRRPSLNVSTGRVEIVEMAGGPETGSPLCLPSDLRRIAELERNEPMVRMLDMAKQNPSKRTYYLGSNGRVSQRKQLVGELVATVRAYTTDHARFLFTEAKVVEVKPFIGQPKAEKWHCPDCGGDFLSPVRSLAYPGQDICPGRACYSRSIRRIA